jgi:hypothetical protein
MLYAMLEASYPTSSYRVYFTKNAANTKDSTCSMNFFFYPSATYLNSECCKNKNFVNIVRYLRSKIAGGQVSWFSQRPVKWPILVGHLCGQNTYK